MTINTGITSQAIKDDHKRLDTASINIASGNDPRGRASAVETVTKPVVAGSQFVGVRTSYKRSENPELASKIRDQATIAGKASVIEQAFASINNIIGTPEDPAKSILYASMDDFFGAANSLLGQSNDPATRQAFIDKGSRLASGMTSVLEKLTDLRFEADQNISSDITEINGLLQKIFELNKSLKEDGIGTIKLKDKRDELLEKLAIFCDLQVKIGPKGEAYIKDAQNAFELVGKTSYGQLSYEGLVNPYDLVNKVPINPIKLNFIDSNNKLISQIDVITKNKNLLSGGRLEGYRDLRDNILVNSEEAVASLMKLLTDKVNSVHNNYSTISPPAELISDREVKLTDFTTWEGAFNIYPVGAGGKTLEDTSGKIRPLTIDLGKLPSVIGIDGKPTYNDIIKEVNEMLAGDSNKLSIGAITGSHPPEYLLNNIKLAGRSNIEGGTFTFDLDIDGNNYFGANVEILSVTNATILSGGFRLEKESHIRTNREIKVEGLDMNGPNNIDIQIRVIGDNGVVNEGIARFVIDPSQGTEMINVRKSGIVPVLGADDMVDTAAGSGYSSLGHAKLATSSGGTITDPFKEGHLVIEGAGDKRLLIRDGNSQDMGLGTALSPVEATGHGFGHYMGFNNFFSLSEFGRKMEVRPDIAGNVQNLATAGFSEIGVIGSQNISVGSQAANMTLSFAGALPTSGDTIIINNRTFTFGAGGGARSVPIGGSIAATLVNLAQVINNDNELSSIMTAGAAGNILTITAKHLGTSGNNFNVAVNLSGPATVEDNNSGLPTAALPATFFIGGSDTTKAMEVRHQLISNDSQIGLYSLADLTRHSYNIKGIKLIPATSNTLRGFATAVSSAIQGQASIASTNAQAAGLTLTSLSSKYKSDHNVSLVDEQRKIFDLIPHLQANYSVLLQQRKVLEFFLNNLR